MISGYPSDIPVGKVLLQLNKNFPMSDRNLLKTFYADSLDENYFFDPKLINRWLSTGMESDVIHKSFYFVIRVAFRMFRFNRNIIANDYISK